MTQTVIPQLRATSMAASLPFYRDGMGFAVDWQHQFEPGFPLFLQLTREGQSPECSLRKIVCQVGGAIYFKVPDVDACAREFAGRGIVTVAGPDDTPWGTREMSLLDPDGNRLRFATHPDG